MAGDWIKIEHALPNKPEIMQMASELGIDEMAVVGHLVCFWTWVDQNFSEDVPECPGHLSGIDRRSGRTGFGQALVNCGWLRVVDGIVQIPNYDVHLSQTAKSRAVEAKRKAKLRKKTGQMSRDVPDKNRTGPGPEKRREEKNKDKGDAGASLVVGDDPTTDGSSLTHHQAVVDSWNMLPVKSCKALNAKRRAALRVRFKDAFWRENWQAAIERVRESPFCNGDNDRNWQADIDWFLKPGTVLGLLEGKYDDNGGCGGKSKQRQRERNNASVLEQFVHDDATGVRNVDGPVVLVQADDGLHEGGAGGVARIPGCVQADDAGQGGADGGGD